MQYSVHKQELVRAEENLHVLRPGVLLAPQEFQAQPQLFAIGIAAEEEPISLADFALVAARTQAGGQGLSLGGDESAVEEKQPL